MTASLSPRAAAAPAPAPMKSGPAAESTRAASTELWWAVATRPDLQPARGPSGQRREDAPSNAEPRLEGDFTDVGAARGERATRSAPPNLARASGSTPGARAIQRHVFVDGTRIKSRKNLHGPMKAMVSDDTIRDYKDMTEFEAHANKETDYLGNLDDGTWLRFDSTGINLIGENHRGITLDKVIRAVGAKSFIYERFSSDPLESDSEMKRAYETENAPEFERFGVEEEEARSMIGAESLFPKLGHGLTLALKSFENARKFFDQGQSIEALTSAHYVGQPTQRYLKIAWAYSKDNKAKVANGDIDSPKLVELAKVHGKVEGKLDAFITGLQVEGFLGDALQQPGNDKLLEPLKKFAFAFSEAMVEMAAREPSSRLDEKTRSKHLKAKKTKKKEKEELFKRWRDYSFEDSVAAATARNVRYAGMGAVHLQHLVKAGLTDNQHPYNLGDLIFEGLQNDLGRFRSETNRLKNKVAAEK